MFETFQPRKKSTIRDDYADVDASELASSTVGLKRKQQVLDLFRDLDCNSLSLSVNKIRRASNILAAQPQSVSHLDAERIEKLPRARLDKLLRFCKSNASTCSLLSKATMNATFNNNYSTTIRSLGVMTSNSAAQQSTKRAVLDYCGNVNACIWHHPTDQQFLRAIKFQDSDLSSLVFDSRSVWCGEEIFSMEGADQALSTTEKRLRVVQSQLLQWEEALQAITTMFLRGAVKGFSVVGSDIATSISRAWGSNLSNAARMTLVFDRCSDDQLRCVVGNANKPFLLSLLELNAEVFEVFCEDDDILQRLAPKAQSISTTGRYLSSSRQSHDLLLVGRASVMAAVLALSREVFALRGEVVLPMLYSPAAFRHAAPTTTHVKSTAITRAANATGNDWQLTLHSNACPFSVVDTLLNAARPSECTQLSCNAAKGMPDVLLDLHRHVEEELLRVDADRSAATKLATVTTTSNKALSDMARLSREFKRPLNPMVVRKAPAFLSHTNRSAPAHDTRTLALATLDAHSATDRGSTSSGGNREDDASVLSLRIEQKLPLIVRTVLSVAARVARTATISTPFGSVDEAVARADARANAEHVHHSTSSNNNFGIDRIELRYSLPEHFTISRADDSALQWVQRVDLGGSDATCHFESTPAVVVRKVTRVTMKQ